MGKKAVKAQGKRVKPTSSLQKATGQDEIYEVVLSYAGEECPYVEAVAEFLKQNDVLVFYDPFEVVELWGKDLAIRQPDEYNYGLMEDVHTITRKSSIVKNQKD